MITGRVQSMPAVKPGTATATPGSLRRERETTPVSGCARIMDPSAHFRAAAADGRKDAPCSGFRMLQKCHSHVLFLPRYASAVEAVPVLA